MNAFTYFLTAISEIKKSKFSQDPSTYELAKITSEFETVVEAGSKLPYKPAKVFVYGNLTEWLVSIVHESVVEKKTISIGTCATIRRSICCFSISDKTNCFLVFGRAWMNAVRGLSE